MLIHLQTAALIFLSAAARTGIVASGLVHHWAATLPRTTREMAMCQALLCDKRFHQLLLQFDEDLPASTRAGGCRRCGGRLHAARYRRKPRGAPRGLMPQYSQRSSFCCAVDGCRKRHTA